MTSTSPVTSSKEDFRSSIKYNLLLRANIDAKWAWFSILKTTQRKQYLLPFSNSSNFLNESILAFLLNGSALIKSQIGSCLKIIDSHSSFWQISQIVSHGVFNWVHWSIVILLKNWVFLLLILWNSWCRILALSDFLLWNI